MHRSSPRALRCLPILLLVPFVACSDVNVVDSPDVTPMDTSTGDESTGDAPPQDTPPQDTPPQDTPPQDTPPPDTPPQDTPPQDTPVDDGAGPDDGGPECTAASECADLQVGECEAPACSAGTCVAGNAPAGTGCAGGTCNGLGACVPLGTDCEPDALCCDGNGTFEADGTACAPEGVNCDGVSGSCAAGACLPDGGCLIGAASAPECYAGNADNPGAQCELCNPAITQTGWTSKPGGTLCDDGNACTQTDSCSGGACVGANPVTCDSPTPCQVAVTCQAATGACVVEAKEDGVFCDDGDACTQVDNCVGGVCVGSQPVDCSVTDPCKVAGDCDTATGQCPDLNADDGTSCGDGGECLGGGCVEEGECVYDATCCPNQQIVSGIACVPASDDQLPCTDPICDANGACAQVLQANACAIGGACYAANDDNPANGCQVCAPTGQGGPTAWTNKQGGVGCDDGDACTVNDQCDTAGTCAGTFTTTWPAPDGYEDPAGPTNDFAHTPALMGNYAGFNTVVSLGSANVHTLFNSNGVADADHYVWTYNHTSTQFQGWWTCRVHLEPGQLVSMWIAVNVGPWAWGQTLNANGFGFSFYTHEIGAGVLVGDQGVVFAGVGTPAGPYALGVGIIPWVGFDACHNSYDIECKLLDYDPQGTW